MSNPGNMSDLWKRLRFVLFAILVYRIGTHIPIPGINPDQIAVFFEDQTENRTILEMFNLFSLMEAKVPITTIAGSMILHGFAEGLYTPDVGLLVANDLMEVLVAMAKEADIPYEMGVKDDMEEEYRRAGQLKAVMAEREKGDVPKVKEVIEEAKPQPAPKQGGLMAKETPQEPQKEEVA